ncbi:MAG: 23S rRNA (guanosine(2251)-2'-O)-methyltransferase RlmB [Chloroflexota bacterium]|nr:23S rRNA (guanosine(2251)-2'-O)-methyltransferase RlmB [Chloroflexota bacterium]
MYPPGASSGEPHPEPRIDLLYGRNSVLEALRAGRTVHRLLVANGAHGLDTLVTLAQQRRVRVEMLDRRELDRRAGDHHQGVVAEAEPFAYVHPDAIFARAHERGSTPLVLALDSLQDPQNFGTLLRTAQVCGADGVLIPEHRAVGVTPAVSNASAGAVEHLLVAQVTNLARSLGDLKSRGVWVYGFAVDTGESYWQTDLTGPMALVVGSEGGGLGRLVRETCDALVHIPMAPGAIQSLNASVAGSLVLYEVLRQRRQRDPN